MSNPYLDWKNFDWECFQTLIVEIAKTKIQDCDFKEHLNPGQKQDGVDILGFKRNNGKYVAIQCKKVEDLKEREFDEIITDFKNGIYLKKSSHFIVATSADLQSRNLQDKISTLRIELLDEGIDFDCWDKKNIEENLRNNWVLVSLFFGKENADRFCLRKLKTENFQDLKPISDFIPRKISLSRKSASQLEIFLTQTSNRHVELTDLIVSNRLLPKRICLIADAYQGKSIYLKQTAFDLYTGKDNLQPLLIDIKSYNVQSVESILSTVYGEWKSIPFKDLLIIIDGLDEVPTDKFSEMVNHINEFCITYTSTNVVFSCRKLFFTDYNVPSKLKDFEIYELSTLNSDDIDWYLRKKIKSGIESFYKAVNAAGIASFLYHPFYLTNIVNEYIHPPYKLPESKIKVIESLIDKSFETSKTRQVEGSTVLSQESILYKKTIEKFAFALQLAGVNSFNSLTLQSLIHNSNERLLLQHSSIVINAGDNWSFVNAMFQEHIAASILAKLDYDTILSLIAIGKTRKKIKTKWIQTLSSLISCLDFNSDLCKKLIAVIEDDNIELIFQSESSNVSDEIKLEFLKKLVTKCISLNIRTLIVAEETIGLFIQSSLECTNYLIGCIKDKNVTERIKIVCTRILRTARLNDNQIEDYLRIVNVELNNTSDYYYASNLIKVLGYQKIGNENLIGMLVSIKKLNESHEFRDTVYELMVSLDLVDKFYSYGLLGLPYLNQYNAQIHHGGSENNLEDFILASKEPKNLFSLIRSLSKHGWIDYFEKQGRYKRDFFQAVLDKIAEVYLEYPFVILSVASFIKELGKKYLRQEFKQIDTFLEKTDSYWLVLRILIDDIFNDHDWELGSLITEDSYDYVLYEFEQGNYEFQRLRNCFGGLRYKAKREVADTFYQLCIDATEGKIINKTEEDRYQGYQNAELKKRENDMAYIRSIEAFRDGVVKYFDAYGKKSIPQNEIYIDADEHYRTLRAQSDSYFIFRFLISRLRNNTAVYLRQCLKDLESIDFFEAFRAEEILNYNIEKGLDEETLTRIIEEYYFKMLPVSNFKNCMWKQNDRYIQRQLEWRLGEIFKKYQFKTNEKYLLEFIWLDNHGSRLFHPVSSNNSKSITELVLDQLDQAGIDSLKQKVIDNMKGEIKLDSIFGTHLALCKQFRITQASGIILEYIQKSCEESLSMNITDAVDIYIELGGDVKEIVKIYQKLRDFDAYFMYHLTLKLYKDFPVEVTTIGLTAIATNEVAKERKVQIAQVLSEIGVLKAFVFLVDLVKEFKKSPHNIQSGHPITNLNTKDALEALEDVAYLVVDPIYHDQRSFHDSAKSIILEWCYSLARKSETDMDLVIDFFEKSRERLFNEYSDANDFNWYINRVLEDFRSSDQGRKSIPEINNLLKEVIE